MLYDSRLGSGLSSNVLTKGSRRQVLTETACVHWINETHGLTEGQLKGE